MKFLDQTNSINKKLHDLANAEDTTITVTPPCGTDIDLAVEDIKNRANVNLGVFDSLGSPSLPVKHRSVSPRASFTGLIDNDTNTLNAPVSHVRSKSVTPPVAYLANVLHSKSSSSSGVENQTEMFMNKIKTMSS